MALHRVSIYLSALEITLTIDSQRWGGYHRLKSYLEAQSAGPTREKSDSHCTNQILRRQNNWGEPHHQQHRRGHLRSCYFNHAPELPKYRRYFQVRA